MKYEHLQETAIHALELANADRKAVIKSCRWIGYTRAQELLVKLEELLCHPKIHRMPNLLIIGETNNGKSMIVRRFAEMHPPDDNAEGDQIHVPVLMVQAPPVPDENRFYAVILERLFALHRPNQNVTTNHLQVMTILKRIGVRMLIIDEIHHIIAGHLERQRQFLNVIKYLGNELRIPIVGVGTKEALRAIQTDSQMANRFPPEALPKWELNAEYQRLLLSFERKLPLKYPSNLASPEMAQKLLTMSEGTIGELTDLLNTAALYAIDTDEERITGNLLRKLNWIPPSERRMRAERLL